jgi:hypothetical protein
MGTARDARPTAKLSISQPAFSLAAVELLQEIGVAAWKIGPASLPREIYGRLYPRRGNHFSTGLARWAEIGMP